MPKHGARRFLLVLGRTLKGLSCGDVQASHGHFQHSRPAVRRVDSSSMPIRPGLLAVDDSDWKLHNPHRGPTEDRGQLTRPSSTELPPSATVVVNLGVEGGRNTGATSRNFVPNNFGWRSSKHAA